MIQHILQVYLTQNIVTAFGNCYLLTLLSFLKLFSDFQSKLPDFRKVRRMLCLLEKFPWYIIILNAIGRLDTKIEIDKIALNLIYHTYGSIKVIKLLLIWKCDLLQHPEEPRYLIYFGKVVKKFHYHTIYNFFLSLKMSHKLWLEWTLLKDLDD